MKISGKIENKCENKKGQKTAHMYIKSSQHFYRTRVRSLFTLVTHSLTHSCLVNLIEVTLVFEDANSKLVELVTVADVDA